MIYLTQMIRTRVLSSLFCRNGKCKGAKKESIKLSFIKKLFRFLQKMESERGRMYSNQMWEIRSFCYVCGCTNYEIKIIIIGIFLFQNRQINALCISNTNEIISAKLDNLRCVLSSHKYICTSRVLCYKVLLLKIMPRLNLDYKTVGSLRWKAFFEKSSFPDGCC